MHKDKQAFKEHVSGKIFQSFVAEHGSLFLSTTIDYGDGQIASKPYNAVKFLQRKAGFIRPEIVEKRG